MGEAGQYIGLCWRNLRERDHLEDSDVDGRIILKLIFKKWDGVGHGLDRSDSEYGQIAGTCECGNEPSGSTKCGECLHWLRTG
jgi:hypothetical protein